MHDRLSVFFQSVGVRDVVEIAILAIFVYGILRWLSKTRGSGLVRGAGIIAIGIFLVAQVVIALFDLTILGRVLDYIHTAVIVGLFVIFQPELRRGLTLLGQYRLVRYLIHTSQPVADQLADAAVALSSECVGALIALRREIPLDDYADTGERIDAALSPALIRTIFSSHSPLHDGAIVVENGRITSAGCQLPLGQALAREHNHLGMRHRAALCLSEETDALILVVSEETGRISIAVGGRLVPVARENVSRQLVELFSLAASPKRRAA